MIPLAFEEMLSPELEKELLKIYVGQNIRIDARFGKRRGILSKDVNQILARRLLLMGFIKEDTWYRLTLYQTTTEGEAYIKPIIKLICTTFNDAVNKAVEHHGIPPRIIGFVVHYYLLPSLKFPAIQPSETTAELYALDRILRDYEVWEYCSKFMQILEEMNLCVKAHFYVSSHGGKEDEPYYVISFELQEYLENSQIPPPFTVEEEKELKIYEVLIRTIRLFSGPVNTYVGYSLRTYLKLLEEYRITEDDVKSIIDKASAKGLTSKYEVLPNRNPFIIHDIHRFSFYIYKELIEPKIEYLLEF
ncbi:MAG: hypothetical protein QW743_05210 [Candidatus Methanomethylicia archaeon]